MMSVRVAVAVGKRGRFHVLEWVMSFSKAQTPYKNVKSFLYVHVQV
jgi:hypothetical protein